MTPRDPTDLLAQKIADQLIGGVHGVSLIGPQNRIDDVVVRLHPLLDRNRLLPVPIQAARTTPELLREAVGLAHAGRFRYDTVLLLIVPDAGRLSADMLRELELAAEAALSLGGLKFLLASSAPLSSILRDAGLNHLHDCLDAHVEVPQVPSPSSPLVAPRLSLADRPPQRSQPKRAKRVALLVAILAGLLIAGLLALELARPPRHTARTPTQPVGPAPGSAPPAAQPPTPAPAVSRPAPIVPATPSPGQPAPVVQQPPVQPAPEPSAPPASSSAAALPTPPGAIAPGTSSLLLVAQPGDTLPLLYAKVYAGNAPPPYPDVEALNPVVRPGTRLIFPAPPGGWRSAP